MHHTSYAVWNQEIRPRLSFASINNRDTSHEAVLIDRLDPGDLGL